MSPGLDDVARIEAALPGAREIVRTFLRQVIVGTRDLEDVRRDFLRAGHPADRIDALGFAIAETLAAIEEAQETGDAAGADARLREAGLTSGLITLCVQEIDALGRPEVAVPVFSAGSLATTAKGGDDAEAGRGDPTATQEPPEIDPAVADSKAAEPNAAEPNAAEPNAAEPNAAEPNAADSNAADSNAADSAAASQTTAPNEAFASSDPEALLRATRGAVQRLVRAGQAKRGLDEAARELAEEGVPAEVVEGSLMAVVTFARVLSDHPDAATLPEALSAAGLPAPMAALVLAAFREL